MSEEGSDVMAKLNDFSSVLNMAKNHKVMVDDQTKKLRERGALENMYVGEDGIATGETNQQHLKRISSDPNTEWRDRTAEFSFRGYTHNELMNKKKEWMEGVPTLEWDVKSKQPGYRDREGNLHLFNSLDQLYNDPALSETDKMIMYSSASSNKNWDNSTGWKHALEGMQSMLSTDKDLQASIEGRWASLGKENQQYKIDAVVNRISTENNKILEYNKANGKKIPLIPIPSTDKEKLAYAKKFYGQDFIATLFNPSYNKTSRFTGGETDINIFDNGTDNGGKDHSKDGYTPIDTFDLSIPGTGLPLPGISWGTQYMPRTLNEREYGINTSLKYTAIELYHLYENNYKTAFITDFADDFRDMFGLDQSWETFKKYFHKEGDKYVANTKSSEGPVAGFSSKNVKVARTIPMSLYQTPGQQHELVQDVEENVITNATGVKRTLKDLGVESIVLDGLIQSIHPNSYDGRTDNKTPKNPLGSATIYKVNNVVKMPNPAILSQSAAEYDKWAAKLTREGLTDDSGKPNPNFAGDFTTYIVADIELSKPQDAAYLKRFSNANKVSETNFGYPQTLLKQGNWKSESDYNAYKKMIEKNYGKWTKEITTEWKDAKTENIDYKVVKDADGNTHYIVESVLIPVSDISSFQKRTEKNKYQLENRDAWIRQNRNAGSVESDNNKINESQSAIVK